MRRKEWSMINRYERNRIPAVPFDPETPEYQNAVIDLATYWTQIDGDLHLADAEHAERIHRSRTDGAIFDYPRALHWQDPEEVQAHTDIAYLPDGGYGENQVRGHLLDVYLPNDAVVRGGKTTPVYIDIHGGGFCYGYKELNRNFNTHLAAQGFGVFSLNYRPAPQTNLLGQLADIEAALCWIRDHLSEFPLSPTDIFITGDSAGACLALLALAIENSENAARAFQIGEVSGLNFAGGALVSGVYNLSPQVSDSDESSARELLTQMLGDAFFTDLDDALPYLNPDSLMRHVADIPPLYLVTSSDDFIQAQTLQLATALAVHDRDFELHDFTVPKTQTLGHVFSVGMTWLPESQRVLQQIRDFSYNIAS